MMLKFSDYYVVYFQENYLALRSTVWNGPVVPIQREWFDHILQLIPEKLKKNFLSAEKLMKLFEDVSVDYERSMRNSRGK